MEIQEIKNFMKKKKISYAQLAEMTGLSVSTITKIFGGFAKYPRVDTMQAIERALGLETLTPEERAAGAVDSAKIALTADQMAWLEIYDRTLEVHGKEAAAALTEAFRKMLDC